MGGYFRKVNEGVVVVEIKCKTHTEWFACFCEKKADFVYQLSKAKTKE